MANEIIQKETLDIIDLVHHSLINERRLDEWRVYEFYRISNRTSLEVIRSHLIYLNNVIKKNEPSVTDENSKSLIKYPNWLFFEKDEEIIPIYNEGISIAVREPIVDLEEISFLLKYIVVPKSKTGINVENHDNKGYHFHYGTIKRDALVRYDVLMTFNKRNVKENKHPISNIPLYIEHHATADSIHIDPSCIGENRKYPIYLVCEKAMKSRGIENFVLPSRDSKIFFPVP